MRAGTLRFPIVIEQPPSPTGARDDEGGLVDSWTTFASCRAHIEMLTGREAAFAQNYAATINVKVTCRFISGVLPTMRVTYGSEVYAINAVIDPSKLKQEMILYCTQTVTS